MGWLLLLVTCTITALAFPLIYRRQCEASHPGPLAGRQAARLPRAHSFTLETINVTALRPHFDDVVRQLSSEADAPVDAILAQEHALPEATVPGLKGTASKTKVSFLNGPTDPNASKPTGGVAMLATAASHPAIVKPQSAVFKRCVDEGHTMAYIIDMGFGFPVMRINVCAWTGAEKSTQAMAATHALFEAIFIEIEAQPSIPVIIAGDFNAHPSAIQPLRTRLERGAWHDVAAIEALTQSRQPLCTGCAHNATVPARRDFITTPPN